MDKNFSVRCLYVYVFALELTNGVRAETWYGRVFGAFSDRKIPYYAHFVCLCVCLLKFQKIANASLCFWKNVFNLQDLLIMNTI